MSVKDLSLKELMELADKGIDGKLDIQDKKEIDKSSIGRYVKEQVLMEGVDLVPTFVIYHDYCRNWRSAGVKVSKIEFFRKFNKYFTQRRKTAQRYYLMNGEQFDLTKEGLEKASKYVNRREGQTIPKKKRKVSGTKKRAKLETQS